MWDLLKLYWGLIQTVRSCMGNINDNAWLRAFVRTDPDLLALHAVRL